MATTSKKAKKDYENHAEHTSELQNKGKRGEKEKGRIHDEISQLETTFSELTEKEKDLQLQLDKVREEKTQNQTNVVKKKEEVSALEAEIEQTRNDSSINLAETPELRMRYIDEEREKKRRSGMKALKEPSKSNANLGDQINLHALGDIHGWAPGLVNWLREREIATCSIADRTLNHKSTNIEYYRKLFPDETVQFGKGIHNLPSWLNGSPFFTEDIPTDLWSIDVEWIAGPNDLMIQIGDMVDRADHSEVVLEMMRRLIWKAQGSCFVLLGNHEEMILLDDFEGWLKNEEKSKLDKDGTPGHQRFNVIRNTYASKEDKEAKSRLQRECFDSLRAHLAHLLLTQELNIRRHLDSKSLARWISVTGPALEQGGLSDEDLEQIVRSGKWGGVEKSLEWLKNLSGHVAMPGALACVKVGGNVFTHAEPTGLEELSKRENFDSIIEPFFFQNGLEASMYILKLPIGVGSDEPHRNQLLWDRRTWQFAQFNPDSRDILRDVVGSFGENEVSTFVHGHSARREVEETSLDGVVRICNIDESITPGYRYDMNHDNPYNLIEVPKGWMSDTPHSEE